MQRPAKPLTPVRFRIQPPYIMKIGIIGYGFVGKALEAGLNDDVEIIKIDPKLNTHTHDLKDFFFFFIFICVPTPMDEDCSQDISFLKNVLFEIQNLNLNSNIVLKSTVLPSHIKEIEKMLPNFVYNPEFLREDYAIEDFISSSLIVFGGKERDTHFIADFYKNHTKCLCIDYIHTDQITAALVKYSINSFLATKVTFFNELNSLFKKSGTNEKWENFINAISKDIRIGASHMQVPGPDGRFGYGGACLPKDSEAFSIYAEGLGSELNVLKTVINTNNNIRASYNTKTQRELDQNIKFKVDE